MRVSVFGLGYVGSVTAACLAKLGNYVIGEDVIDYKVDAINNGKAANKERGLDSLIKEQFEQGRLSATKHEREAVMDTDVSFVCVGTPTMPNGDIDLTYLERVTNDIGNVLRDKNYHIVAIRSTIPPKSLGLVRRILEKSSGKKIGEDFDLVVNPEFLREGTAIQDFLYPPYIIVGTENPEAGEKILSCYDGIYSEKIITKPEEAAALKYVNNSWHALKVTFANEIGVFLKSQEIDAKKVMNLFCRDKKLNLSQSYLTPGFAYGGSCLPKDTLTLKNMAKKSGIKTPLIDAIAESNLEHVIRALELIESQKKDKIGILGLTFKADTDDIRGNPILFVLHKLLSRGYDIKIYDPNISSESIRRIDKSYREEIIDLLTRRDLKEDVGTILPLFTSEEDVLNQELIVISNRDLSLEEHLKNLSPEQVVVDLQCILNNKNLKSKYVSLS